MPSAPLGIVASHDHFKEATGGTITYSGGYTIHTFTSSGTFTIGAKGKREIEWEIIGGGGPGGIGQATGGKYPGSGGGGGAGGRLADSDVLSPYWNGASSVTAIPVTVGAGGSGSAQNSGTESSFRRTNSSGNQQPFFLHTTGKKTGANAGGGGVGNIGNGLSAKNNSEWCAGLTNPPDGYSGSGGGGGGPLNGSTDGGTAGTPNANAGGGGTTGYKAGGGGGSSAAGQSGVYGGNGGAGTSGVCGGGGGGKETGTAASASDGGGAGGVGATLPGNGTANTGGGGGGAGCDAATNYNGGNGGSGKVIIKYKTV